jgi:hypothetical protein
MRFRSDIGGTVDQLRADIDHRRTGDKVAGSDPAAAPLGQMKKPRVRLSPHTGRSRTASRDVHGARASARLAGRHVARSDHFHFARIRRRPCGATGSLDARRSHLTARCRNYPSQGSNVAGTPAMGAATPPSAPSRRGHNRASRSSRRSPGSRSRRGLSRTRSR